jgi:antitoxin (DNA-binding transcriptional repressor) of toxin-antitoxin stability system
MRDITMRQLRDTRQLERWLESGETLCLRKRNRPLAQITPIHQPPGKREMPDFAARRRKIFGDRILPGADLVIEERGRY